MAHEPDSCFYCEHGEPHPVSTPVYCQDSWSCLRPATQIVQGRHYCADHAPQSGVCSRWVAGGVPAIYNDDYWRPGCMCDFEGHTRTGCTHDS